MSVQALTLERYLKPDAWQEQKRHQHLIWLGRQDSNEIKKEKPDTHWQQRFITMQESVSLYTQGKSAFPHALHPKKLRQQYHLVTTTTFTQVIRVIETLCHPIAQFLPHQFWNKSSQMLVVWRPSHQMSACQMLNRPGWLFSIQDAVILELKFFIKTGILYLHRKKINK